MLYAMLFAADSGHDTYKHADNQDVAMQNTALLDCVRLHYDMLDAGCPLVVHMPDGQEDRIPQNHTESTSTTEHDASIVWQK